MSNNEKTNKPSDLYILSERVNGGKPLLVGMPVTDWQSGTPSKFSTGDLVIVAGGERGVVVNGYVFSETCHYSISDIESLDTSYIFYTGGETFFDGKLEIKSNYREELVPNGTNLYLYYSDDVEIQEKGLVIATTEDDAIGKLRMESHFSVKLVLLGSTYDVEKALALGKYQVESVDWDERGHVEPILPLFGYKQGENILTSAIRYDKESPFR